MKGNSDSQSFCLTVQVISVQTAGDAHVNFVFVSCVAFFGSCCIILFFALNYIKKLFDFCLVAFMLLVMTPVTGNPDCFFSYSSLKVV